LLPLLRYAQESRTKDLPIAFWLDGVQKRASSSSFAPAKATSLARFACKRILMMLSHAFFQSASIFDPAGAHVYHRKADWVDQWNTFCMPRPFTPYGNEECTT